MGKSNDFSFLDATAMAELVRKKEVQPFELVEAAIERIEHLNPVLNAVVTPMYDQAYDTAKGELPDGLFTGVPFLLKDALAAFSGVRMSAGAEIMRDYVPKHDSELVARHKRAGLIVLGKTNTPEFGLLPTTEPRLFGPTKNPWDTNLTPGGSSGGSAAAVAAGLVAMAHGNDGGGSIRNPASMCGVFGLKPTRARNPLGPGFGDVAGGIVVEHALTRSVRDSAALLDATSGPDIGDPYWAPLPKRPFIQEIGADPGKLRIAFSTKPINDAPVHDDCVAAVLDAAKLCNDLGHEVIEDTPQIQKELLIESFINLWSAMCASSIEGAAFVTGKAPTPDLFEIQTWALYERGKKLSAVNYLMTINMLQRISRKVARFFVKYDILLTPTLAQPPFQLGTIISSQENPMNGIEQSEKFTPFTPICNITGQPAMSIPLYWNDDTLPIGTHFIGRFGDEATLFRLASQLESARPWIHRKPNVII